MTIILIYEIYTLNFIFNSFKSDFFHLVTLLYSYKSKVINLLLRLIVLINIAVLTLTLGAFIDYFFSYDVIYSNFIFIMSILRKSEIMWLLLVLVFLSVFIYIEASPTFHPFFILIIKVFSIKKEDLAIKMLNTLVFFICLVLVYDIADLVTPSSYDSDFFNRYTTYKPFVIVINFSIAYLLREIIMLGIILNTMTYLYETLPDERFIEKYMNKNITNKILATSLLNFIFSPVSLAVCFISYTILYVYILDINIYLHMIFSELFIVFITGFNIFKGVFNPFLDIICIIFRFITQLLYTFIEYIFVEYINPIINILHNIITELATLIFNDLYNIIGIWIINLMRVFTYVFYPINLICKYILDFLYKGIYLMDGWGNWGDPNQSGSSGFPGGSYNNEPPNPNFLPLVYDDNDSNQYSLDYYLPNTELIQPLPSNLLNTNTLSNQLSVANNFPNLPLDTLPNLPVNTISNLPVNLGAELTYGSNVYTNIVPNSGINSVSNINGPYSPANYHTNPIVGSFTNGINTYVITLKPNSDHALIWLNGQCIGAKSSNGTIYGRNILGNIAVFKLPDRRMFVFNFINAQLNLVKKIVMGLPNSSLDLLHNIEEFDHVMIALHQPDYINNPLLRSYKIYNDNAIIPTNYDYEAGHLFNINRNSLAESPVTPYKMVRMTDVDYVSRFYRFPKYVEVDGCKTCRFEKKGDVFNFRYKEQWLICMIITHNINFSNPDLGIGGGFYYDNLLKSKFFEKSIQEYYKTADELKTQLICSTHNKTNMEIKKTLAMRWYIDCHLRGNLLWNKSFKITNTTS